MVENCLPVQERVGEGGGDRDSVRDVPVEFVIDSHREVVFGLLVVGVTNQGFVDGLVEVLEVGVGYLPEVITVGEVADVLELLADLVLFEALEDGDFVESHLVEH